jgi:hypothetical protein
MEEKLKTKIISAIVFILVISLTIAMIQIVGVGIDFLRGKLNLSKEVRVESTLNEKEIEGIIKIVEKAKPAPSKFSDYDYYQKLEKLPLVTSTESWVEKKGDAEKVEGRVFKKFIRANGNIANAYLFVDVSVDNGEPLKIWDSIYVSLRKIKNNNLYIPLDGHLLRSESLKVPDSDTTQLLYDLRQIPFTAIPYSDNNKFTNKDWLLLLQNADKFQFETFLSTLREGGMIDNISIGYECSKETPDCGLRIEEE